MTSLAGKRPFLWLAIVILAMSVVGCASTPGKTPAVIGSPAIGDQPDAAIKSYRVNSGDRLRVTVFRHVDLSGEFVLDGGGFFALPLIGAINGGGRTPRQLESDIETAFKDGGYLVNPQVGIEVLTYRPFYILGEVNQPGSYPYVSGMTAINAVALAGGFTYRAKRSSMTISHSDDGPRRSIDATGEILPGEILTIHESFF